ncbi:hypothetical protein [Streptomyces lavendofoliae]|uniref:Lipoprotein n=1 Tax=Streptomyces lavendofoliae TaxID=67314 RepID=A0A918HU08_9ACTN|nr:hypothetical protein [Streptomyces lavendofoliae]GGU20538.1 hypothetical protein GCM10010274_03880 [Streptomyces lavendofoliae]
MTPGVPHRGRRHPLPLALLSCAALLLGCGSPPHGGDRPNSPAPGTTSPIELCVSLIGHWAREELAGRAKGDFMQKGLSGGQNEILEAVVAEALEERRRTGADGARKVVERETNRRCAERHRSGGPTGHPWR